MAPEICSESSVGDVALFLEKPNAICPPRSCASHGAKSPSLGELLRALTPPYLTSALHSGHGVQEEGRAAKVRDEQSGGVR